MEHIEVLKTLKNNIDPKLINTSTGKYYTHYAIATHLINSIISAFEETGFIPNLISVIDPFAGDGRLIEILIQSWINSKLPSVKWQVELWDINNDGLRKAEIKMDALRTAGTEINYNISNVDAFKAYRGKTNSYDIVLTNPPWEILKPDSRELKGLDENSKKIYIESMKIYDSYLTLEFPSAQPLKKFAGWGTNLSRVGLELSHKICKEKGYVGIVMPSTVFADEQSSKLRIQVFEGSELFDISFFPAEAKLFKGADVNSSTLVFKKGSALNRNPLITIYNKDLEISTKEFLDTASSPQFLKNYSIPILLTSVTLKIFNKMSLDMVQWDQLEKLRGIGLWAGREIDETRRQEWLCDKGNGLGFVKGSMVSRYELVEEPTQFVNIDDHVAPRSCKFARIAWRDVSRTTQKRRLIATIISAGTIAGNSLNVAFFIDGNTPALISLLGIMNSLCFEFQLRQHLATGHISLSSVRKVNIPTVKKLSENILLQNAVKSVGKVADAEHLVEAIVAKYVYGLTLDEFSILILTFNKITQIEKQNILLQYENLA